MISTNTFCFVSLCKGYILIKCVPVNLVQIVDAKTISDNAFE